MRAFDRLNTSNLKDYCGRPVQIACVVTKVARQISRRRNAEWGKITVEDFHGTGTVLAFKDMWQHYKDVLRQDAVVLVSGKVSGRERDEEDPPIFLDEASLLEDLANSGALAVRIELPRAGQPNADTFARAREILMAHPGGAPVELALGTDKGAPATLLRSRSLRVDPTREALEELQEVLGGARVCVVRARSEGRHGTSREARRGSPLPHTPVASPEG